MNEVASIKTVSELVDAQRYGAEYQPLVDTCSGATVAFEALARFYDEAGLPVSPEDVFRQLHDSPMMLARVEHALKQIQLTNRPTDRPLFINLDPDAYLGYGASGLENPLLALLHQADNIVVELIENTSINDAAVSHSLCDELRRLNKKLALDDVGAPDSMIALPILSIVDYIKFDRSWLYSQEDRNSVELLSALVSYAKQTGKRTVLEGVETPEHLQLAQSLGMDLVQGYLFRERFLTVQPG